MNRNELDTYVQAERAKGVDDEALLAEMISSGWTRGDAEDALAPQLRGWRNWFLGFSLRNLLSGRINRNQYILCFLSAPLLMAILVALTALPVVVVDMRIYSDIFLVILGILTLTLFLYWLSVFVRRLHDIGYSGYYALLLLVPIVGNFAIPILVIYLLVKEGQPAGNLYGPPPNLRRPFINVLINTAS